MPGLFFASWSGQISRWLVWFGCGIVGIGLVPTLADYLSRGAVGLVTDPVGQLRGDRPRIVPVEAGVYFPRYVFVVIGLVVLIAAVISKRCSLQSFTRHLPISKVLKTINYQRLI
ncbi:hypothetical protein HAV22_22095 [Massilia sp. TW-1]|uniref:Uncharacterized protein n=1 Tax=Telluria antibiotica TaxID=2717319 RepID=A0ABX0PGD3_9BURK|nr:hypothetical protein [Telluria antibiotica]